MARPRVRPTTAKVLESLMAILEPDLEGARVLDLFAGSGRLGTEALQRGGCEVVFVEQDPGVAARLAAHLPPGCRLVRGRLPGVLARVKGRFGVILADPPYGSGSGPETLRAAEAVLEPDGVMVFEHHHKDAYPAEVGDLRLQRRQRYGETALSFYRFSPLD